MAATGAKASGLTPTSGTATPLTTEAWSAAVLAQAGLPITANNIANLSRMIQAESSGNLFDNGTAGNWLRDNNPLNVAGFYGGHSVNYSWGQVFAYDSVDQGINATAQEINSPVMKGLHAALAADAPTPIFSQALISGGWASAGYNAGDYQPYYADTAGNKSAGPPTTQAELVSWWRDAIKLLPGGAGPLGDAAAAVPGAVGGAISSAEAVGKFLGKLSDPTIWKRVGVFALGGAVFGIGALTLFGSTDTGKKITSQAIGAAALIK